MCIRDRELAAVLQQRRQLRIDEPRHVLEMIGLVRLEQQQRRRPVRRVAELGEEEGVCLLYTSRCV